jgi:hypothetical protein
MRRLLAASAALLLTVGAGQSGAAVSPVVPAVPGTVQTSANVTHVGTIPIDGVGVSMRLVKVGKQLRAFVSGAAGLSIYDATDPLKPTLLGHLPFYNWENEDIAVSADGRTAFLTEFEGTLYLHVVDVSNPLLPRIVGTLAPGGAHTVECADTPCNYLFGSEGQTYDVRDRTHPVELPAAQSWRGLLNVARSGHNLHKDASGLWISDTTPLVAFRLAPDALHLKQVTTGDITLNTQYQHNNVRPRADRFKSRTTTTGPLRDGELLLGEGETNFTFNCDGQNGAFSTWSMVGFDKGRKMRQIDTLRPVSGTIPGFLAGADPAINAMGCSGHWFTQKDGRDGSILVAAGWYEHGTRFLSVNPRTGKIKQIGYFQPNRGATSAAYWIPGTDVVWSIDYHSGIDILQFDQNPKKVPTTAKIDASWLSRLDTDPFAEAVRQLCAAGAKATTPLHARLHEVAP